MSSSEPSPESSNSSPKASSESSSEPENEKPPILGSWKNLYWLLVGFLVLQIIIYYLISISFR